MSPIQTGRSGWRILGTLTYLCSAVAGYFFFTDPSAAVNEHIPAIIVWHGLLLAGGLMSALGVAVRSRRLEAGGCCGLASSYSAYVLALVLQAADTKVDTLIGLAGMIATLVGLLLIRIGALVAAIRLVSRVESGPENAG